MNFIYDPEAPPAQPELLEFAVALAERAGEVTLRWFGDAALAVDLKPDGSPVTAADRAAERLIRDELEAEHPADAVLGEEEGLQPGTSGRWWCIDPIDGTKAFARGVPLYSSLLAIGDEHGPAIGVVHMPALKQTVYAGRGLGCFQNGAPCRVSSTGELDSAYITTSAVDSWPHHALLAMIEAGCTIRTWGDGYGHALVASGRMDAMLDPGPFAKSAWDLAPMPVIITEAGGRFSDRSGSARIDGDWGIATNGRLHAAVLARSDVSQTPDQHSKPR